MTKDEMFDCLWLRYPLRDGRKDAKRHFSATVNTTEDWDAINKALRNYKNHLFFNKWKKPKNGSTWFNNWEDWIDWKEEGVNDTSKYIRKAD